MYIRLLKPFHLLPYLFQSRPRNKQKYNIAPEHRHRSPECRWMGTLKVKIIRFVLQLVKLFVVQFCMSTFLFGNKHN